MAWFSFVELDKAVDCVIRLASCLIVVSVCLSSDALSQHLITPERMKGWSQSKNNTQLWMGLVIEARFNAVKSNAA